MVGIGYKDYDEGELNSRPDGQGIEGPSPVCELVDKSSQQGSDFWSKTIIVRDIYPLLFRPRSNLQRTDREYHHWRLQCITCEHIPHSSASYAQERCTAQPTEEPPDQERLNIHGSCARCKPN